MNSEQPSEFILTSEYLKFIEFCDACATNKYIGVCIGRAGVGKTSSAKFFAEWQIVEPLLGKPVRTQELPPTLLSCTAAFYTPDVSTTAKRVYSSVGLLRNRFEDLICKATEWHCPEVYHRNPQERHLRLLIVDEAQRLSFNALEALRDIFDRSHVGLILVGMPGFDRKLNRYPQLHSRVGFLHEFKPLAQQDMKTVIESKWRELALPYTAEDAVSAAIIRLTNGNLRLVTRIFIEIDRLRRLNRLASISVDVVEVARQGLLLGTT